MEKNNISGQFFSFETDRCGNGGTELVIWLPEKMGEKSEIAVIAMHAGGYTNFTPMKAMAERGFIAAGVSSKDRSMQGLLHAMNLAIQEVKARTNAKKIILMAHSQGGCILSLYQYIAENGTGRFTKYIDRLVPFPEIEALIPADGLMLLDGNYGIMSVMALDPGVRVLDGSYERIPELDIFNPDNGYRPGASHYPDDFIRAYQKAQIALYKSLLSYAKERREAIQSGKSHFRDDEPVLIPGGAGGSSNNKPFIMDSRLLGRTAKPRMLLHPNGSWTEEIVYTNRERPDSVPSWLYRGAAKTTVMQLLQGEMRFSDDFGYDDCHIWGIDEDFLYYSTRENVKYIHVPLICQGNTASHEFVNMEITYENAVSLDKEYFASLGSCHDFAPVSPEYDGIGERIYDHLAEWAGKEGRFL